MHSRYAQRSTLNANNQKISRLATSIGGDRIVDCRPEDDKTQHSTGSVLRTQLAAIYHWLIVEHTDCAVHIGVSVRSLPICRSSTRCGMWFAVDRPWKGWRRINRLTPQADNLSNRS